MSYYLSLIALIVINVYTSACSIFECQSTRDINQILVTENEETTLIFNCAFKNRYSNDPLVFLILCSKIDHYDIASVLFDKNINSLQPIDEMYSEDTKSLLFEIQAVSEQNRMYVEEFNVTLNVKGHFIGRTYLQLYFILNTNTSINVTYFSQKCKYAEMKEIVETSIYRSNYSLLGSFSESTTGIAIHTSKYGIVVVRKERPIDTVFNVIIVLLVAIVNLGMGCKTDMAVIKSTFKQPVGPVIGFCSQFILMPLISFAAAYLFYFGPALSLGFFALGCSPGGSASNAYTLLLGGDVSLSITMTFINTIAALGMVPLWMFTLGPQLYTNLQITIPFQNIIFSLLGLIIPVGIGFFLKIKQPKWAEMLVKTSKVTMVLFLIFMLTVGVYANLYIFHLMNAQVLVTSAVLPYLGFLLGGLVAFAAHLNQKHILTVAVETGIQNTGIAIVLLLLSLDHPESDISIVAPITSALFTPIPLWIAIGVRQIHKHCLVKHHQLPTEDEKDVSSHCTEQL